VGPGSSPSRSSILSTSTGKHECTLSVIAYYTQSGLMY
jgi:hypothetical protein